MDETRSRDSIRKAASDAMKAGGDIGRRVRDLTLESLANRRFDREGIREVVRAVTEGMAAAAPASGGSMRQAMGQAFRGMDEALTKSVEAGHAALRQMVAAGRGISDNEVKQALAGLKKIEQDFVATVSQVASSANERVRPELEDLVKRAARAGTDTGRQAAHLMTEFAFAGIELAGEFSARFALASIEGRTPIVPTMRSLLSIPSIMLLFATGSWPLTEKDELKPVTSSISQLQTFAESPFDSSRICCARLNFSAAPSTRSTPGMEAISFGFSWA